MRGFPHIFSMHDYENLANQPAKTLRKFIDQRAVMKRKFKQSPFREKHYKISHPNVRTKLQQDILRCFARDLPATETAKLINRDIRTINPFYRWLRKIVAKHHIEFLRFREHDMDYDLMLFLSHSAMITMYWLNTDQASPWDKHTLLLRGEEQFQGQSTAELMRYTLEDEARRRTYVQHSEQNYHWLTDRFMAYRMKKLRTPMCNNPDHAQETLYRFMINIHVLLNQGIAGDLAKDIKGRFIGEEGNLEKAGVLHIDELFEKHFIHAHQELKANIIFSDLMDWLHHHPEA